MHWHSVFGVGRLNYLRVPSSLMSLGNVNSLSMWHSSWIIRQSRGACCVLMAQPRSLTTSDRFAGPQYGRHLMSHFAVILAQLDHVDFQVPDYEALITVNNTHTGMNLCYSIFRFNYDIKSYYSHMTYSYNYND